MPTVAEIVGACMVAAGIAMSFTASIGIGDHQTARELISSGLILLGAYYYGRYKAYERLAEKH